MASNPRTRRLLAAAVTLVIALSMSPQLAAAETVQLPTGAAIGSMQANELVSTSCPSAANCVSVGWYTDSFANEQALVEGETNGVWSGQQVNLSTLNTLSDPYAYLDSVSCTSVGNCVAVGQYDDASGNQQGLIETESNGTWTARKLNTATLPSVNSTEAGVELTSVSCPAARQCVAVGQYTDAANSQQGLIVTEAAGIWTAHEADLSNLVPAGNPAVNLLQVSCASVGNCAAGGDYLDSSYNLQGLLETDINGVWSAGTPDFSTLSLSAPGVSSDPGAVVESVSCPVAGGCSAVGYYNDGTDTYQGLLVNQVGGSWQPATAAQLPADAAGETAYQGDLYLTSLSCPSAGDCTAVGTYDATAANNVEGMELNETGGTWAPGQETILPAPSAGNPGVWLASVSCQTAGQCVASGSFKGSDGNNQALVAQLSGGVWTTGSVEEPTTYNHYNGNGASVSCTRGGYCAVGGYTLTAASPFQDSSLLLAPPAAASNVSASIAGSGAQVSWTPPSDTGGLAITGYTVRANDLTRPGQSQMLAVSPGSAASFTALTPMDTYTFTVRATSLLGTGFAAVSATSVTIPPTPQQISRSLTGLLAPRGPASQLTALAQAGGYTFAYNPLESGNVTVDWYTTILYGKYKVSRLVASGSAATSGTTPVSVPVTLTPFGSLDVKTSTVLRLRAVVTFVSGGTTVTRTVVFTLY
jgi:hypothetical protein